MAISLLLALQLVLATAGFASECRRIRNRCWSKDLHLAVGYHTSRAPPSLRSSPGGDKWRTEAWWRVDRGTEIRLCFSRGTYLYAFFSWVGGGIPDASAVTLGTNSGNFCLKGERTKVHEYEGFAKMQFEDAHSKATSWSCKGLGKGARTRKFTVIESDVGYVGGDVFPQSCPGTRAMNGTVEVLKPEAMSSNWSSDVPKEVVEMLAEGKQLMVLSWDATAGQYRPALQRDAEPWLGP